MAAERYRVLVVDDDLDFLDMLEIWFDGFGVEDYLFINSAFKALANMPDADVYIFDENAPNPGDGGEMAEFAKKKYPNSIYISISGNPDERLGWKPDIHFRKPILGEKRKEFLTIAKTGKLPKAS